MSGLTVSVNGQSGVPYVQYGTDAQKNKAAKFVRANDAELNTMATDIANFKNRKTDKKIAKGIALGVMSLPVVGGVVTGAVTKGKLSAKTLEGAKSFAKTAAGMGVALGVVKLNNKLAQNKKADNFEKKHPILTIAGLTAAATGIVAGAAVIGKKVSPKVSEKLVSLGKKIKLDQLSAKIDKAPEAIRGLAASVSEKVSLPAGVKERISTISSKVKMPSILKDGLKTIKESRLAQGAVSLSGKVGKFAAKNPVTAGALVLGSAMVGFAAKKGVEINETKKDLKAAQLRTANNLINAYAAENESLKSANLKAADSLEKANIAVAEDASADAE